MNAPIKVRTANLKIPSNPNYSDSVTKANNTHTEKKDRERDQRGFVGQRRPYASEQVGQR